MSILIVSTCGSSSSKNIGSFLLKNREFFEKNYKIEIKRIRPQDIDKIKKEYGVQDLPFIKINNKIIVGEKQCIVHLIRLIQLNVKDNDDINDYMRDALDYKIVNGKHVFPEDEEEDSKKIDYNRQIEEFNNKKKLLHQNTKPPTKEDIMPNNIIEEKIDDYEVEYENWLEHMRTNND